MCSCCIIDAEWWSVCRVVRRHLEVKARSPRLRLHKGREEHNTGGDEYIDEAMVDVDIC